MKKIILLLLVSMISLQIMSQGILFEMPDWQQVIDKADKENKIIFLYANVYDCAPCDDLEKYAFQDSTVGQFFNNSFVNVSFDMESFPGVELAERYQVYVYPGILFLNRNGEIIHRSCGAMTHDQLLYEARLALDEEENLRAYRQAFFKGNRDMSFLEQYGAMLENACIDTRSFVDQYFKTLPKEHWKNETSWMMIQNHVSDPFSKPFTYLTENYEFFVDKYGQDQVDDKIYNVLLAQFVSIYEGQDLTLFAIQSLQKLMEEVSFVGKDELVLMTDMQYAEQIEDWSLYATSVIRLVTDKKATDPFQLNEFAWKFYLFVDEEEPLKNALSWMKKVIKSQPTATNYDTYASLLFKLKDTKSAIKYEEAALLKAQSSDEDTMHYQVQLQKFRTQ